MTESEIDFDHFDLDHFDHELERAEKTLSIRSVRLYGALTQQRRLFSMAPRLVATHAPIATLTS